MTNDSYSGHENLRIEFQTGFQRWYQIKYFSMVGSCVADVTLLSAIDVTFYRDENDPIYDSMVELFPKDTS